MLHLCNLCAHVCTSFGPDQMEEGVHAWTSPGNPDPLKPGVKLMAGCNSAGVGVTCMYVCVYVCMHTRIRVYMHVCRRSTLSNHGYKTQSWTNDASSICIAVSATQLSRQVCR